MVTVISAALECITRFFNVVNLRHFRDTIYSSETGNIRTTFRQIYTDTMCQIIQNQPTFIEDTTKHVGFLLVGHSVYLSHMRFLMVFCVVCVVCRICLFDFVCKYVYLMGAPCWHSRLNDHHKHCVICEQSRTLDKNCKFFTPHLYVTFLTKVVPSKTRLYLM